MIIEISTTNYGGGFVTHKWTLKAYGKSFYLGQDAKFCDRVLGMSPRYIVQQIGSDDLRRDTTRKKLAKFICGQLDITRTNAKAIEPWGLSAE